MVSRAFQILSDPDKKARYDKFGGDPDSRFSPGAGPSSASSPFSGFSGGFPRAQTAGGHMFEEEISPEELFNRFFNGGFGPMGGGFSPFGKSISSQPISSALRIQLTSTRGSTVCFQHGGRPRIPRPSVWRHQASKKATRSQCSV